MWGPFKLVPYTYYDVNRKGLCIDHTRPDILAPEDSDVNDIYCRDYENIDLTDCIGDCYDLIKHDIASHKYLKPDIKPTAVFIDSITATTKSYVELKLDNGDTRLISSYNNISNFKDKTLYVKANSRMQRSAVKVIETNRVKMVVPTSSSEAELKFAFKNDVRIYKAKDYADYLESKLPMLESFDGLVDMFRSKDKDTRDMAETILKAHNLDKFKLSVSYLCRDRSTFLEDVLCKFNMKNYNRIPSYFDQCTPEDVAMVKKLMYETAKEDLAKLTKRWGEVIEFDMRMKA